jgi:N-glycosylase/DNA lyase
MPLQPYSSCGERFLNPHISVNSGQTFLWEQIGNSWYGIYADHILKFYTSTKDYGGDIYNNPVNGIEFCSYPEMPGWPERIFRLDDHIEKIISSLSSDSLVCKAIRKYPGLRLMRQDPYQCIFSFICATNSNISMIRRMLKNLSKKFGPSIEFDGREFHTFPSVERFNKATINELTSCGVGYRAKAIKAAAHDIILGNLDFERLVRLGYCEAKAALTKVYGVGNKIADCVLLFSLEKVDAFPIDVWILKALSRYYSWLLNRDGYGSKTTKKMSQTRYEVLSACMRNYFGKYSGYAQQYIYYYMRETAGKKW